MTDTERAAVRALAMAMYRSDVYDLDELVAVAGNEDHGYWLFKVARRYARLLRAKETR